MVFALPQIGRNSAVNIGSFSLKSRSEASLKERITRIRLSLIPCCAFFTYHRSSYSGPITIRFWESVSLPIG
jgi:hypothetical protein